VRREKLRADKPTAGHIFRGSLYIGRHVHIPAVTVAKKGNHHTAQFLKIVKPQVQKKKKKKTKKMPEVQKTRRLHITPTANIVGSNLVHRALFHHPPNFTLQ